MKTCNDCSAENNDSAIACQMCGMGNLTSEEGLAVEQASMELLAKSQSVKVFTVHNPSTIHVTEELGVVFGNSSKQAFWGLSTQANRLSRAYEVALANLKYDAAILGADAVVGVTFALNNSTGSSAALLAGSSEAVMLLGTAVRIR